MIRFFKNDIFSVSGSRYRDILSPVVEKDGTITIVVSGKEDLFEFIQSFKDSTDISYIMASVAAGDLSALNKVQGFYGDFTKTPKTYAEFLQLQIDAKRTFDSLPADTKKKFDNDVNKFMSTAGNEDWFKMLGIELQKEEENIKESEVDSVKE